MLHKRLKEIRQKKGLTQQELSDLLKISRSTYAQYEIGRREPDNDTLLKIADFFDVSVDYLLGRTDDPTPYIEKVHARIEKALEGDPEAEELLAFWQEMKERENLQLLFKQVRPLSDDSIRRVIKIIKAIEDEEEKEES